MIDKEPVQSYLGDVPRVTHVLCRVNTDHKKTGLEATYVRTAIMFLPPLKALWPSHDPYSPALQRMSA